MKIGIITTTNKKGQVVIPKRIRDQLGIAPQTPLNIGVQGAGVYLQPIRGVAGAAGGGGQSYIELLARTKGAWSERDWSAYQQQRKKEKKQSKSVKNLW